MNHAMMAGAAAAAATPLILNHHHRLFFFRFRPKLPSPILLLQPPLLPPPHKNIPINTLFSPRCTISSSSLTTPHFDTTTTTIPPLLYHEDDDDDEEEEEEDEEENDFVSESQQKQEEESGIELEGTKDPPVNVISSGAPPNLSVKEKKELASYAHSLGKKLKSQQVGKSGVTPSLAASFIENLESNELLKIKVHNNCPGELTDVIQQLEKATGSVAVGQIGRVVILYRPSLSKMKATEKYEKNKQLIQRLRKEFKPKSPGLKEERPKLSGRGRRGSSRV
ncbi:uncharacterized protein LOC143886375 [Tasmannia lanceolata]|uniref:uncharacterized protein LOC143886375 n=1 Tax=Tasmannia lanceolata TaxID=3420 RepID=UPI004062B384